MKGKTKLIFLCICTALMLGVMTWEFFTGNFFGLSITAIVLFAYYPIQFWDAISRMREEKARIGWEERVNKSHQEIFDIYARGRENERQAESLGRKNP